LPVSATPVSATPVSATPVSATSVLTVVPSHDPCRIGSSGENSMKLRLRTLAFIGFALVCLNLALFATSSSVLLEGFARLESQEVQRDMQRALDVLSDDIIDLDATVRDYAEWDDTYAFAQDHNNSFVRSNLIDRTFDYLRLNFFIILDRDHHILFEQAYDLNGRHATDVPPGLLQHLGTGPLFAHETPDSHVTGIEILPEGPVLIGSRPIVTSQGEGPMRGTLIAGRYLGPQELQRLSRLTQLRVSLRLLDGEDGFRPNKLTTTSQAIAARSPTDTPEANPAASGATTLTQLADPQLANAQLANAQLANAQLANAQLANAQLANAQINNSPVANSSILDAANTTGLTSPQSWPLSPFDLAARQELLSNASSESHPIVVKPLDHNEIAGYALLRDLQNQPSLMLRVDLDRDIYAQGETSLHYLLLALLLMGLAFGVVTLLMLERLVLSRLMNLSRQVGEIGNSGDPSKRVEELPGNDELSELANILNRTLHRLESSQAAVRKAEQNYRSIFENAIEGIFQTTLEGQYISANPALAEIYGFDSPEDLMTTRTDVKRDLYVNPQRRREFVDILLHQGSLSRFESQVYRADGQVIWISEDARVVRDAQGEILYFEGTVSDITERRVAEAELRNFRDRLQAILEAVPGSVSRVSRDLRYLEVNRHLADSFGLDPDDFVGQDIGFLGYGEDFRAFVHDFFAAEEQEATREVRREVSQDNGDQTEHYLVVAQKYDGDNAAFIVGIDITERKQAERAVREADARYRGIFENAIEGIFQITADGYLIDANPAMARLYGYDNSADFMAAIAQRGSLPYVQSGRALELRQHLEAHGAVSNFESEAYRCDGERIWISENATARRDEAGRLLYYEGTVEDITERRRSQERLLERSRLSLLEAEVGVALCRSDAIGDILSNCAEMMVGQLNCAFVRIWTFNPTKNVLELQAQASGQATQYPNLSFDTPLLGTVLQDSIELGSSVVGEIAQTRRPVFWSEMQPAAEDGTDPAEPTTVYFAGHPLVVADRLVGAIALYALDDYTEAVSNLLGWMANAIAVGIDRAWARRELTSRREALLFQLSSQIRNSLDLEQILAAAVHGIRSLLQTDRCLFAWYRPHDERGGSGWDVVSESRASHLESFLGQYSSQNGRELVAILLDRKILRADDVTTIDRPSLKFFLAERGYTSVLAMPVQTRSGAIGIVKCGTSDRIRTWSDSDIELLRAVTDQLAIAIDQAELYTQARRTARQAQQQAEQLSHALQELQKTQTQLIQTEKMSSLGQMVAGVAHEINNPTTFIHGNLTYARTYANDLLNLLALYREHYPQPVNDIATLSESVDVEFLMSDLPKTLESMRIGADRIHQIVISLRNFSRLDQAEMKPVDIHEGIENTLMILQHRFKPSSKCPGIEIIKEYGDLPLIVCYAGQLNQVFMNTIANSIDALESAYSVEKQPPLMRAQAALGATNHAVNVTLNHAINRTGNSSVNHSVNSSVNHSVNSSAVNGSVNSSSHSSSSAVNGALKTDEPASATETDSPLPVLSMRSRALETREPPTIRIRTELRSPDRVRICIADNGTGMSEKVRAKLFDPFFTTKPVGQGTGLGLSICYQIVVEKHRGHMDCVSHLGQGTEFFIEIPVEQPEWSEST
jgi:PAS domain S-box-containing protein